MAEGSGAASEVALRERQADHGGAVLVVVFEQSSVYRTGAEDAEKIGVDQIRAGELRAPRELNAHFAADVVAERFENLTIGANVDQVAACQPRSGLTGLLPVGGNGDNS